MHTLPTQQVTTTADDRKLPWLPLGILAGMGFVLIAMETMPAGLLPIIAAHMHTSEGTVGLFVSAFALGTVLVTAPAITLTRNRRRKPLLASAVIVLLIANSITALSSEVVLSLTSRFIAGAAAGTIWGMLALYGRRISPPKYAGLSLAVVSIGAPAGFAFGTPVGAWLGTVYDWRWSFGGLSILGVIILGLIIVFVPDAPAQAATTKLSTARVFRIPGVALVLAVIVAWMLAHNTIYTYVSPYLRATGTGITPALMLLIYGISAIGGLVVTGALIDRHPRPLLHLSAALFVIAGVILLVGHTSSIAIIIAASIWGVTFGGAPTQLQAALSNAAGENADVANAFLPVAFNIAIFAAGIFGAILLTQFNGLILAALMIGLGTLALALTLYGRRAAFPANHSRQASSGQEPQPPLK